MVKTLLNKLRGFQGILLHPVAGSGLALMLLGWAISFALEFHPAWYAIGLAYFLTHIILIFRR